MRDGCLPHDAEDLKARHQGHLEGTVTLRETDVDETTIFNVTDSGEILRMSRQDYDSEAHLQGLVADHPQVLASVVGERPWLLVRREMPVADSDAGGGRWSLDHLFIDADAIPTMVEAKRASNTDIRRKVIGQLLEYAANGTEYWPSGEMRRSAAGSNGGAEHLDDLVGELTGGEDPDVYWERAEENLRTGHVRLVVLADGIPKELQRVIEFLNERMPDTEVIAIEVPQYVGSGQRALVPRIVGNTTAAQRVKAEAKRLSLDEMLSQADAGTQQLADKLEQWTVERGGILRRAPASIGYVVDDHQVVRLYAADGSLEFGLSRLRERGLGEQADALWTRLSKMCPGKKLAKKHLYLPPSDVLRNWEEFEGEILPAYMEYLETPRPT